jgi:hypothetical protein
MQKPRNFIFAVAFLSLLAGGVAHAQLSNVGSDPVQYTVSPETPGPQQKVTISVDGVGTFIGNSSISWTQNGKTALSGVGATQFTFTTGALGSKTIVSVRIVSGSNGTITHDFIFQPSLINLIWEADTTAPPLYRGKSLYTGGSNLKIVAFPTVIVNGKNIATNSLSFQWFHNTDAIPQQSGLGRSVFAYAGDELQQQENVAVDVYYGNSKVGHGEISIPASQPLLLLYDKDPLRGVLYDTAIPSAATLNASEITIQATPYFFANSSLKNGALTYSWTLNGDDATGPNSAKGMLTLRQAGAGQGAASVGVTLQNTESDKYVQAANAALQLVFGQSSGSTLFGL